MAFFSRRRRAVPAPSARDARRETVEHLTHFTATRVSVEAYIEPPTRETQTTILLIAASGEWTRRRVPDARAARDLAAELRIPVYDVNFTGYPQRMREWDAQHKRGI